MDSVPLIPHAEGPFSLQLVLGAPDPSSGDPFILLSEDDDYARVYLAVIKGDADSVVDFCAIKLLRNAYRAAGLDEGATETNVTTERRWALETERIEAFRSAAAVAPRLLRPDSGSEPGTLPPLFFCRTGRRFFAVPCPRCGSGLATCRDDALLSKVGLPAYTSSRERYLYCRSCSEQDEEAPFYAFDVPERDAHRLVLSAADLFRDLGESLAVATGGGQTRPDFPCPDCLEAAKRFQISLGSGVRATPFWEDRWVPLNFYDSPFLITGFGALSLDELADLLGGRPKDSFAAEGASLPALSSSARLRYPVGGELSPSMGRLLFESDSSGLDAAEVLFLKLVAFRQTVDAVLEYTRAFGRPHLDLHPRHVLFDLSRAGDGLPWLWAFQARLHGLGSAAHPERLAGVVDVLIPPRNPIVPYAPPEVLEFHLAPPRSAQLVLTDLEEAGKGQARGVRLHGKLTDSYGIYPAPRTHDCVLVTVDNEALGLSNLPLVSRPDPRVKTDPHELAFSSEPVALEEATAQKLKKTLGVRIPGARYKVYPAFGAPSDIFSLGMILLRLLVGNDQQDAKTIAGVVEAASKHPSGAKSAATGFLEADADARRTLGKPNVFYQQLDRADTRPNAIPDGLWTQAVLLGLRLSTRVEGFSLCESPADYDEVHPTAKLEAVLHEVELLAAQLRTLLFQRHAAHLEIQQVLSEVLAQETLGDRSQRPAG